MKNKDDPKLALLRFNRLWKKECEITKHLESVDWADPEGIRELANVQQERAEEGRKLNIGLIQ